MAAILSLAGGVAAVVGSFLAWFEIGAGPFTEPARGVDGWEGKAAIVAGVLMMTAGIRALGGARDAIRRLGRRAAVGGLGAAAIGLYTALTAKGRLLDVVGTELSRAQLERALETGLLRLSIAVGLYVVIAGGLQGILAATLVMRSPQQSRPSSGAGLRGWHRGREEGRQRPRPAAAPGLPAPPPGTMPSPDAGPG